MTETGPDTQNLDTRGLDPKSFPPPWNYLIPLGTKALIWSIFFTLLYLLRHFLPLVFLTFVFAYIAEHGVQGLAHRLRSRRLRTCIVFTTLIGIFSLGAVFIGPQLKKQAANFEKQAPAMIAELDKYLQQQREKSEFLQNFIGEDTRIGPIISEALGFGVATEDEEKKAATRSKGNETQRAPGSSASRFKMLISVLKSALSVTAIFLLSVLFAFLIVLDLPRISAGIRSLQDTRLKLFYDEVSSTIVIFGKVLGRFLEAQAVIAILNTAFTALGLLILGIPAIAFLSCIVFICSFVPVAGVFISTFPICLEALLQSGLPLVVGVVIMVCIVHILEAYVMNPLIMGRHLKLNPVLVLTVLVIGHEVAGIWGLLLGVPVVTYIFGHAIKGDVGKQLKRLDPKKAPAQDPDGSPA